MKLFIYNWTTKFNFGKYKGLSVEEVFKKEPSYLFFSHKKVSFVYFSEESFSKILKYFRQDPDKFIGQNSDKCFGQNSDEEILRCLSSLKRNEKHYKKEVEKEEAKLKEIQERKKHQYDIKSSSRLSNSSSMPSNYYENYYECESYGEYAGSYAQDVEGLSDNFINDALDGNPDAYWNID